MKITVEVDEKEIKLPVDEALNVLYSAVENEPNGIGGCHAQSSTGLICCRGKEHTGRHVALGIEDVLELWRGE